MDTRAEKVALFRYALIAPLVLEVLPRGELTRRAEEIAARNYQIPYSQRTSLSVDTLLDWALRYRRGGFPALAPKQRCDRGQPRVVPPQLAELIERLKRENPHRTGMTLLRELALVSGTDSAAISAATLYRFLKQRGLTTRQLLAGPAHKKFEAERSNQIWQSDMLFGPYVTAFRRRAHAGFLIRRSRRRQPARSTCAVLFAPRTGCVLGLFAASGGRPGCTHPLVRR
jgi:putative transposase